MLIKNPKILLGIPKIIVLSKIFSKIEVNNINNLNIIIKASKINKNAKNSYNKILIALTPLKYPPNLKKGRFSYIKRDKGFLKIKATTKENANLAKQTASLVTPLLKPIKNPKAITKIITKSKKFKSIIPYY